MILYWLKQHSTTASQFRLGKPSFGRSLAPNLQNRGDWDVAGLFRLFGYIS